MSDSLPVSLDGMHISGSEGNRQHQGAENDDGKGTMAVAAGVEGGSAGGGRASRRDNQGTTTTTTMGLDHVRAYIQEKGIDAEIVQRAEGEAVEEVEVGSRGEQEGGQGGEKSGEMESQGSAATVVTRIKSLVFTYGEDMAPLLLVCPGKHPHPIPLSVGSRSLPVIVCNTS
jgi:hypothetical protein